MALDNRPFPPAPPSTSGTAQGNGDPVLALYKSEATPLMIIRCALMPVRLKPFIQVDALQALRSE